jgi:sterol 3beta-glucosyltransferase
LSGVTNKFRRSTLGIPPLTGRSGPGVVDRLRVPYTYCWSPSVIPKPKDWRNTTDISGFYFLDGSTGYQPPAELDAFLRAGEAPIYIGCEPSRSPVVRPTLTTDRA